MTIRTEDWYRFAQQSTTVYEVIEPAMSLEEARGVYARFRANNRLHPSVTSPEWAYERIGQPHLLMEYVYLLTHGRMLEERLREQVRRFSELGEDPARPEVLRQVAASADTLGTPVDVGPDRLPRFS